MSKPYEDITGTGNYRPVVSATNEQIGKTSMVKVIIDPTRLPRNVGDGNDETQRRYSYDLVRSIGKETGISIHAHTGVDGPHFDAALHRKGNNLVLEFGVTGGDAVEISREIANFLNGKAQDLTANVSAR